MTTRQWMILMLSLLLIAVVLGIAAPECDRACFESYANKYLEALVVHNPSRVPIAKNIKFTENGKIHRIHTILISAPYGMKQGW